MYIKTDASGPSRHHICDINIMRQVESKKEVLGSKQQKIQPQVKARSYWDSNPSSRKHTDEGIRIRCDDQLHYRTLCMNCVGMLCGGPGNKNPYSKWAFKISLTRNLNGHSI